MEFKKLPIKDLQAATYNPRKALKPGDKEYEKIKENLAKTYGADVCEMESAGVLLACLNMEVPCLIVKAISDGKGGVEEFKQMVTHASQQYVEFVQKLSEIL